MCCHDNANRIVRLIVLITVWSLALTADIRGSSQKATRMVLQQNQKWSLDVDALRRQAESGDA